MRASRLLSIQMLLQSRGRMSAQALAEELQVSVRTLHRDIDQLSAAGVPVYAERGRMGGFALLEGWKTTLTGFTPTESQAVFLSGLAGPAAQLGLGAEVKSAQRKLLAALPADWREQAQAVSTRLHLDPADWYRDQEPAPMLQTVAEAVWSERQLAMRYESWNATSSRTVSPLGLVLKAGIWYLVAVAEKSSRTFRVSNILAAEVLNQPVRRPKSFDLAAYWTQSIQRFERELYTGTATVLATPKGLKGLSYLSGAVAKAAAAAPPARRKDGRVRLRIPIESIEHATGQLLRLAPEVEVLGPAALRETTLARIQRIAQMYALPLLPQAAARTRERKEAV
jgi:predicted DNA-binding transcriptional regulator YafY